MIPTPPRIRPIHLRSLAAQRSRLKRSRQHPAHNAVLLAHGSGNLIGGLPWSSLGQQLLRNCAEWQISTPRNTLSRSFLLFSTEHCTQCMKPSGNEVVLPFGGTQFFSTFKEPFHWRRGLVEWKSAQTSRTPTLEKFLAEAIRAVKAVHCV